MKKGEIASTDDWSTGWYCLRSKPRMENLAAASISSLEDVEVFLPRTQRQNQKIKQPVKPLFRDIFRQVRPDKTSSKHSLCTRRGLPRKA